MADTSLAISFDAKQVQKLLAIYPARFNSTLKRLIDGAAVDVQRELRVRSPVGATGNLRRSIRYSFSTGLVEAVVEPEAPYAEAVEYGSRPHWTSAAPGSALARWAKMRGINPYAVQKSIARKGTRAHPFVGPTYRAMKPIVERNITNGISELVQELDNGNF